MKLFEFIFYCGYECFCIVSVCLDELSCEFLLVGVGGVGVGVVFGLYFFLWGLVFGDFVCIYCNIMELYFVVFFIWLVEFDDFNLVVVLERLVDIKKGNILLL